MRVKLAKPSGQGSSNGGGSRDKLLLADLGAWQQQQQQHQQLMPALLPQPANAIQAEARARLQLQQLSALNMLNMLPMPGLQPVVQAPPPPRKPRRPQHDPSKVQRTVFVSRLPLHITEQVSASHGDLCQLSAQLQTPRRWSWNRWLQSGRLTSARVCLGI